MSELLDVVDEKGTVLITGVERDIIHKLGLPHSVVFIALFDEQGRILLQKRSKTKETNPGKWTYSASGHVDSGESVKDAAYRESFEEIGLKNISLKPVHNVHIWHKKKEEYFDNEFGTIFVGKIHSDYPFVVDKSEVE